MLQFKKLEKISSPVWVVIGIIELSMEQGGLTPMNYYERIQKAVDFIEESLCANLDVEEVAQAAYMSVANLYRLFFALTGHTVKEYIRCRRLSEASRQIATGRQTILGIALQYGFESHEAFARAFKKATGSAPKTFKQGQLVYQFERVNILDKYFTVQDQTLLDKYPDIKVLKQLEPVRVAYYRYYGKNPESGAFRVISAWLKRNGLQVERDGLRIFGFDNPSPAPGMEGCEYGYEVWVTVGEDQAVHDPEVKTKYFEGGLYVVTGVKGGVEAIAPAWKRFVSWLKDSKYDYSNHQWLEEHLNFNDDFEHLGGIDLYMPIKIK